MSLESFGRAVVFLPIIVFVAIVAAGLYLRRMDWFNAIMWTIGAALFVLIGFGLSQDYRLHLSMTTWLFSDRRASYPLCLVDFVMARIVFEDEFTPHRFRSSYGTHLNWWDF